MALSVRKASRIGIDRLAPATRVVARLLNEQVPYGSPRHPLVPAAVRVERSRVRNGQGDVGDQTALTLWFGEGPQLPAATLGGRVPRAVARTALAMAAAAAFGAMAAIATQREAERVEMEAAPRRLEGRSRATP